MGAEKQAADAGEIVSCVWFGRRGALWPTKKADARTGDLPFRAGLFCRA
ncbi:hypothetical protein ACPVTF_15765 [Geobacillus icigianus]|nr:hypothetical protein [Geobacillus subterraneus]KYD25963.1 hypothetical protein B4113_1483 [Geobacillus sp. B4113_201601]